jgi:acetyl/propionyl-CoA carboxylase alpha subunit
VIVARLDDGFRSLVERWDALFADCIKMGFTMDQASFRSALALSDLRVLTLPNNYNFRALVAQNVAGEVKILHAHGELKRIGETINASTGMRLYSPKPELIHGFHPK